MLYICRQTVAFGNRWTNPPWTNELEPDYSVVLVTYLLLPSCLKWFAWQTARPLRFPMPLLRPFWRIMSRLASCPLGLPRCSTQLSLPQSSDLEVIAKFQTEMVCDFCVSPFPAIQGIHTPRILLIRTEVWSAFDIYILLRLTFLISTAFQQNKEIKL